MMTKEVNIKTKNIFKNVDSDAFRKDFTNKIIKFIDQMEKSKRGDKKP